MLKTEVRDAVYKGISDLLLKAGFRGNKREAIYTREFEGGFQEIGIPLVDYAPDFKFSLIASIRIDAIEAVSRCFPPVLPKFKDTSISLVVGLRYLMEKEFSFEVSSEEMLLESIDKLRNIVTEKMLPLLDRCVSVNAADAILNGAGGTLLQINPHYRAMSGIVAAGLSKRSDLKEIAEYYREILVEKRYDAEDLGHFDDVVAYMLAKN